MIKHLFTTLCALALITAGSIPALAAEADTSESARYYPISVEEYTYEEQNEPRINKVYQLSLSDNPSGIPTKDFVRNGRLYYLLDMTRKDEVGVDTKPHTETVTRPSDTSNMEEILQGLEAELEVTTEEGYTGVLRLDHTSVQVTTDGYLRFFPQRELHKFFIFCYQTDRLREDLPKPDFHYLNRRRKHQKREERS